MAAHSNEDSNLFLSNTESYLMIVHESRSRDYHVNSISDYVGTHRNREEIFSCSATPGYAFSYLQLLSVSVRRTSATFHFVMYL